MRLFENHRYWIVKYTYPKTASYGVLSGQTGEFFLEIFQAGDDFEGLTIEPSFVAKSPLSLFGGRIVGKFENFRIRFQKTYFQNTGERHLVFFDGEVDFSDGEIYGTWRVPGLKISNSPIGKFQMFLDEGEIATSKIWEK